MSAIALNNQILRGLVGSTAYGTNLESQDRDEMGVFIEPPEYIIGLSSMEHYISRDQPDGVRSQPGDLDLTLYSLRKYVRLAARGNPTVVELLWLPKYEHETLWGNQLRNMRQEFISKESGERFLGYLISQKKRLTGELARNVSRPELVAAHGYDTKFAAHALRLGYEGCELLRHSRLSMPMQPMERNILLFIRQGKIKFDEALSLIEEIEKELTMLVEKETRTVNTLKINKFLVEMYQSYWSASEPLVTGQTTFEY